MTEVYLSISDISTFKRCRQRWDWSSGNRQSLRHKASPRQYLTDGLALHEALDAQARGKDWEVAVDEYLDGERAKLIASYKDVDVYEPWDIELQKFDASAAFMSDLIHQYFDHYGEDPLAGQGLSYLATEVPFKLFLFTTPEGNDVYFVGTWDGVAVDTNGKLFLVENKTYSSIPDSTELMFHDQCTGYAVAFHALTNTPLTGMLYNGVNKRLITKPRLLKNGKLSTDKRQLVTSKSYIAAMYEHEIDPFDDHYTEILNHLHLREIQGDDRFFYQEKFFYSDEQLESWYDELLEVAQVMTSSPPIYRTVPYNGCGDCLHRDLCHTTFSGGDVSEVMRNYTVGTYGTYEAMANVRPTMVASVEQLMASLRD